MSLGADVWPAGSILRRGRLSLVTLPMSWRLEGKGERSVPGIQDGPSCQRSAKSSGLTDPMVPSDLWPTSNQACPTERSIVARLVCCVPHEMISFRTVKITAVRTFPMSRRSIRVHEDCPALEARVLAFVAVENFVRNALVPQSLGDGEPAKASAHDENMHQARRSVFKRDLLRRLLVW